MRFSNSRYFGLTEAGNGALAAARAWTFEQFVVQTRECLG